MTDEYPYFSQEAIEVATEGIRAEARKWYGFADQMAGIRSAMGLMTLQPTAFAVIDHAALMTSMDQAGAYSKTQEWLFSLFHDASGKMERFGDALKKCADEYDQTDGRSAKSFDNIATS
ncbi:hypothetical protein [Actinoplanes sp. NPDC051859]|uniref:hypothetical protein n=1 Tax=Actinoplanes sp. NPDC051859 TaxID=3363909 RepID=UPI0037BBFD0C